jgi:hypothetical protein
MASSEWGEALARPSGAGGEVLTPWDDYPVHQSAALLASVTPALSGWSERFYFNVLRPSGEIAAILGGGVYPARGTSECYMCRLDGDVQHNVRAFGELPVPGRSVDGGPFSLRCETPLKDWAVAIDVAGAEFAGTFSGINPPYLYDAVDVPASEPDGPYDLFRHFIAVGRWDLSASAGIDTSGELIGVRDRTWGVRTRRVRWHNWCVFQVGDATLTLIHQELADGSVMHSEAGAVHADGRVERLQVTGHDVTYDPQDRQVRRAHWELAGDDGPVELEYECVGRAMRLAGAGYTDTQGESSAGAVQRDTFDLGDPDVARDTGRGTMDCGARGQVTGAWEAEGIGVVESAIARNHARYGVQLA